jgi:hypothetical protein
MNDVCNATSNKLPDQMFNTTVLANVFVGYDSKWNPLWEMREVEVLTIYFWRGWMQVRYPVDMFPYYRVDEIPAGPFFDKYQVVKNAE